MRLLTLHRTIKNLRETLQQVDKELEKLMLDVEASIDAAKVAQPVEESTTNEPPKSSKVK